MPKRMKAEDFVPEPTIEEIAVETLTGDIRDVLLMHARDMRVPWTMLAEDEQRDKIDAFSRAAEDLVRKTVGLVVQSKFPVINVSVGAVKIDKGVEIKLQATSTVDNITKLAEHGQASAVLVLAEAADYFGERAPATPDKDQPDLPLAAE